MRGSPSWGFLAARRVGSPWRRGFPPGIFRHPAGGVVGSRPDRRVTFLRGQESNQRNRRGPLPAPWTPGAVVRDLQPLLAFNLEPSSGLSAAWGDTRRPPPFGCCAAEGAGFEGFPLLGFSDIPAGGLPLGERFPLLGFSGILPEGLSGPAPTGGTFLARASPPPCLPLWGRAGRGPPGASAGPLDPRRCRSRLAAALCLQARA